MTHSREMLPPGSVARPAGAVAAQVRYVLET
jgi:hypothetical protein